MTTSSTPPTAPITRVLVANRGEIARRVIAGARTLGLGTAAVYSDPDADAPHAAEAEVAVRLPGASPAETYLRADAVIDAARAAGADAIHPGYGFLSESADFARAVIEAGLTWVGPGPGAIAQMGSKVESKKLMASAGVPVLGRLDPGKITEADLPVLVKASAGGGGRGMRVVTDLAELDTELEYAAAEAASAFGDDTVFCERYLTAGRHIEVQILADAHGTVWALGERECSIQRRHQKVVEEAPSPLVDRHTRADGTGMRAQLLAAATEAARAIGYVGAGTVEFLADETGAFYFLEMNTRLQVEHPVTELTFGVDLVAWQLRIAAGEALPADPPAASGHAIEVRLYAEDPAADWLPQSGTVHTFAVPAATTAFAIPTATHGVRLDSGIESGDHVGVHYDPMLAKVIGFAPDRTAAARLLAAALAEARIHGLVTNRDLLVRVLRHPAFLAGDTDTAFFDTHGDDVLDVPLAGAEAERVSALAATLAAVAVNRASARVQPGIPAGWRNIVSAPAHKVYSGVHDRYEVDYLLTRDGLESALVPDARLVSMAPDRVVLEVGGMRRDFTVAVHGAEVYVDSALGPVVLEAEPRFVDPATVVAAGSLLAPMPGTVIRLGAAVGETVTAGQPILWLEAMKMEHTVAAPVDGVVTELGAEVGAQVELGAVLAVVADPDAKTDSPTDDSEA